MQDGQADTLYKKFCGDLQKDDRLRKDLKRHNWLLRKLNKSNRSQTKAVKMKPSSPQHKPKGAPKLRPTLPVCLPLSFTHKFLNSSSHQENRLSSKDNTKKSPMCKLQKKSILGTCNINPQENKSFSKLEKTVENLPLVNNEVLRHEHKYTDTFDLELNAPTHKLNVIRINIDFEKKKISVPGKEASVQVPECDEIQNKITTYNKQDISTIPLPLYDQMSQTEDVNVINDEDEELLRAVKRFNFTLDDLERFNQINISNNNNQPEFENQNLIIDLDDNSYEPSISENDGSDSVEIINESESIYNNRETIYNKPLPNVNRQILKQHIPSNSLFERLKLWSDLNKVILRTFYEGILLGKEKDHDKVGMENHLSQLSQNLVDQICDMVTNYSEAHGRQTGRAVEIIELDDCDDDDTSLDKRPSLTDKGTNGQINGTKEMQKDTQKHQEYTTQNNYVSPNCVTPYRESEQENQNEATLHQITQNQVIENQINPDTVPPTNTQILQNQLLPAHSLRNFLAPVNEMHNISSVIQERATYTQAVPQRPKVLREFRMNSMPNLPADGSSKNDSRLPNYYSSYSNQPIGNTLYPSHIQNIGKQRSSRFSVPNNSQNLNRTRGYYDFYQNIQTPINANYHTANRTFQNEIRQNQQYNSPANYQNVYPYNYRNSYGGNYRFW